MKILFLNTDTAESVELVQLLVDRLQGDGVIIESYYETVASQVMIVELLTKYDISFLTEPLRMTQYSIMLSMIS